ncbi:MAG: winged helix-turn-helix transcriptional regulator [Alphaproteobacteria bacterium]|nr:winged helix-turn-helix transcriptional regulator [Alphaproteobacteria bacterium]
MTEDPLSIKLHALADPTRRAMLARLARGEATVNELAQPFAISLPAISKHIKVLEKAGLITRSRAAQQRPCQLSPGGLKEIDDWMKAYRDIWLDRLDRLEDYLKSIKE